MQTSLQKKMSEAKTAMGFVEDDINDEAEGNADRDDINVAYIDQAIRALIDLRTELAT